MSDWPLHIRARMLIDRLLSIVGPDYIRAHKHSSRHRSEIEGSKSCGCFYCQKTFSPNEIQDWFNDEGTALCPRCGIDSVIGSGSGFSLSPGFLQKMHHYWFERSYRIKV